MIGIKSVGVHIPMYRLSGELLAQVWGRAIGHGEKAVAGYDEDSITMAVASTANCLANEDTNGIQALNFASTTSPYREKLASAVVATAADLSNQVIVADFANSLRSGTIALQAAIDSIKAGTAQNVVVVAADCRQAEPGSQLEALLGDGAAALLISDTDVAVSIEATYSLSDEFLDQWRKSDDTFINNTADDHFIWEKGYLPNMEGAITALLKKTGQKPADFSKAILSSPEPRSYARLARRLGFDVKTQVQGPLFDVIGNCGTSHCLLMLIAALEQAEPGDALLFANYSDGADAFSLRVTDNIERLKGNNSLGSQLDLKMPLSSYEKYLKFRNLVLGGRALLQPFSSPSLYWRERGENLRFHGVQCKLCSRIQYPRVRVCRGCGARDQFDEVRLAKTGKVFTFVKDYYWDCPDPPLVLAEVDLDRGGRVLVQMTDRDADVVKIGMPVEMVLRNYHQGGGFNNYSWKCRPLSVAVKCQEHGGAH